jgi:hypothetical protein
MTLEQRIARIGHDLARVERRLDFLIRLTIERGPAAEQPALLERLGQELDASSDALRQSVEDATAASPKTTKGDGQ